MGIELPPKDLVSELGARWWEDHNTVMGREEWNGAKAAIALAAAALEAKATMQRSGKAADEWENAAAWLRTQFRIEPVRGSKGD
jgi:hypothetical protein